MTPVKTTTKMSTNAKYKFGKLPSGWRMYVIILRILPIQSIMANQFVTSLKNLIQAGVFFFSGNLLSPSSKFLLIAISVVNPF